MAKAKEKVYDEDIQVLLMTVVRDCESEDQSVRERQLRVWRRLKLFWEGFTRVWYSEVAHDWRIWGDQSEGGDSSDQAAYDKSINVFRAYLESIIAALSITVPPVKCYPDDADDTLDLDTARAGDQIAAKIFKHNNVNLLWLHGLFVFCTEGMVAAYNYSVKDEKYGVYEEDRYEEVVQDHEVQTCPKCGYMISKEEADPTRVAQIGQMQNSAGGQPPDQQQQAIPGQQPQPQQPQPQKSGQEIKNDELDEFDPQEDDVEIRGYINETPGSDLCPSCMQMMDPEIKVESFPVTRWVGTTSEPKARVHLECYGGMNVKIPNYAKNQSQCPYLIYSYEEHYAVALERYKDLKRNETLIQQIEGRGNGGAYSQYDAWARLSPQYQGEFPINVVTRKLAWLRPSSFNILKDEDDVKELQKLFPFGVCVEMVNDTYAKAYPEALDDHWTLTFNPLADYVHYDPLGLLLASVQEITSDLLSLTLQTIEHGVGLTFADPAVLNFKAFEQTEVVPGGVFPAVAKSGKSIGDGFFETKTATLSGEVLPFFQNIQSLGQLVSGALPSLFGGAVQGGGDTASEYSMSRAQALQRLQNTWKMFCVWWKEIFGKAIPEYIKNVKEDEREVQIDPKTGGFINVFIRKANLSGKIGKVELEANENLPLTWGQRKDMIMQLLNSASPQILELMNAPENRELIWEAIGIDNFFVPGEDDREKQLDEIKLLIAAAPIETGDPQLPEVSSVDIDPDYDNHQIHFEICRQFVQSQYGQQMKLENEQGYRNVLLHGKEHLAQMQNMQMQQAAEAAQQGNPEGNPASPASGAPPKKPNPKVTKQAPITDSSDVHTIQ